MDDIPAPKNLRVGFSLDKNNTHTFALGWEFETTRKTIRYMLEFSVDKRKYHTIPAELCTFTEPPERRVDIPFAKFVELMQSVQLDIRKYRYIYWRLTAEFHDTTGTKNFGQSHSNIACFEMPPLE
ncbi:MAG: hypothetical protein LBC20_10005 [Planctomycetaceae bacterium]|jgi:hypothetical protein|nr:hypothetical protein [Planctomycetaceae bacterium]